MQLYGMVSTPPADMPVSLLFSQIDRLSRRQRSLITARQLDQIGLGQDARYWAVATGRLHAVRRGVYGLPGVEPTWERAVLAAILAAGADAVASHTTAARLWDLFDGTPPAGSNDRIHVTAKSDHRLEGVVTHRRS